MVSRAYECLFAKESHTPRLERTIFFLLETECCKYGRCFQVYRHDLCFVYRRSSDRNSLFSHAKENSGCTGGLHETNKKSRRPFRVGQHRRPLPLYHASRSEEHTSELQLPDHLVCRLLLEKKKKTGRRATRRGGGRARGCGRG